LCKNAIVVVGAGAAAAAAVAATAAASGAQARPSAKARSSVTARIANSVNLAGEFNSWSTSADPLTKGADGVWTITKKLARSLPLQVRARWHELEGGPDRQGDHR
jgi:hypothetical protein